MGMVRKSFWSENEAQALVGGSEKESEVQWLRDSPLKCEECYMQHGVKDFLSLPSSQCPQKHTRIIYLFRSSELATFPWLLLTSGEKLTMFTVDLHSEWSQEIHYTFVKIIKDLFTFICVGVCGHVCLCTMCMYFHGDQKRLLYPLKLELWVLLNPGSLKEYPVLSAAELSCFSSLLLFWVSVSLTA